MIFHCPFCQLDTAGNHAVGCPNGGTPTWNASSGGTVTSPVYVHSLLNDQLDRIEKKLNRLLNLLDSKRGEVCSRCGNPADCPTILPYGSKYENWVVCGKCVAELIDPAISAASKTYDTMDDFIASLDQDSG